MVKGIWLFVVGGVVGLMVGLQLQEHTIFFREGEKRQNFEKESDDWHLIQAEGLDLYQSAVSDYVSFLSLYHFTRLKIGCAFLSLDDGVGSCHQIADFISDGFKEYESPIGKELETNFFCHFLNSCQYIGLLEQVGDDVFSLTDRGRMTCDGTQSTLFHWIRSQLECGYFESIHQRFSFLQQKEKREKGKDQSNIKKEEIGSFYDSLNTNAELRVLFAKSMSELSHHQIQSLSPSFLSSISNCDVVCDVGGGSGIFLASILAHYPRLKGVVVDIVSEIDKEKISSTYGESILDRLSGTVEDWLNLHVNKSRINRERCDCIVMKGITSDWGDENVIHLLSHSQEEMREAKKGKDNGAQCEGEEGVILIFDHFLKTRPISNAKEKGDAESVERFKHQMNLMMLSLFPFNDAHQRTTKEMKKLIAAAQLQPSEVMMSSTPSSLEMLTIRL